jgi:hypothetical protein
MIFNAQRPLAGLIGPSSSSSSQFSQQYDYSGLEDHLKRQEDLASLADAGRSALYDGDVRSGLSASRRIPALLQTLRAVAPDTTTQRPRQLINPLSKVTSSSGSSSANTEAGQAKFAAGPEFDVPEGGGGGGNGGGKPAKKDPLIDVHGPTLKAGGASERLADEGTQRVLPDGTRRKKRDNNPLPDQGEMLA